jgi:D-glucuronyl C5-epimerase-like protein
MRGNHLQFSFCDVAAGVASVAFARMRSLGVLLFGGIVALGVVGGSASGATGADRVLVMDRAGRVHARVDVALLRAGPVVGSSDPIRQAEWGHLDTDATRPNIGPVSGFGHGPVVPARAARRRPERTLRGELVRLLRVGAIDRATYLADRHAFDGAIRSARRLHGTRRAELLAVLGTLHDIAARGQLTASRLPQLFLTLRRNVQWWTSGRVLGYGQRVEFSDSELVWEAYPGQGLQLQPLATFGKANGLWMAHDDERLRALLDEMAGLAVQRGPALAWEYDFSFGGGAPPWTSAMSQATAIQVLARASERLGEARYLQLARQALPLFQLPPPLGVRLRTRLGTRYLLYSFAPGQIVINAFAQTLVGLFDYAQIANDGTAAALFRAGDAQARRDVPAADTGAWSLYQLGGPESDLGYHELLRDFLRNLCDRTGTDVYCTEADRFTQDLRTPPDTALVTHHVPAKRSALVRFRLDKISRVGMTIRRGNHTLLATSATVSRGTHAYVWQAPARPGSYDVTLLATDLAGNSARAAGTLVVVAPKHRGSRPPRA